MYTYQGSTLEEVKAYRSMQSDNFDFGNGMIVNEGCGEEAYYKMHIQMFEEWEEPLDPMLQYYNDCNRKIMPYAPYFDGPYNKNMSRAKRRKNTFHKINHRLGIVKSKNLKYEVSDVEDKLNILNKNDLYCRCKCCTPKTRFKGIMNWKHSDQIKIDRCNLTLKEYQYEEEMVEEFWDWHDRRTYVEDWYSDEYEYYYDEWIYDQLTESRWRT